MKYSKKFYRVIGNSLQVASIVTLGGLFLRKSMFFLFAFIFLIIASALFHAKANHWKPKTCEKAVGSILNLNVSIGNNRYKFEFDLESEENNIQ